MNTAHEEALKRRIEHLEQENCHLRTRLHELEQQLPNTSTSSSTFHNNVSIHNTNINNNNNINININCFGNEDTQHIKENSELVANYIQTLASEGVSALTKKIYFDKEYPQNNTIMLNIEDKEALMIHKGDGKWEARQRNVCICEMMKTSMLLLHDAYKKSQDLINDKTSFEDRSKYSIFWRELLQDGSHTHTRTMNEINETVQNNGCFYTKVVTRQ